VIVNIRTAVLKPIDRQLANGSHYGSSPKLPVVCGMDGVGRLDDGTRVFFAMPRWPYGGMAERTVAARSRCLPAPDDVDDETAVAVVNPGLSAWASLTWRAKLAPGETVLILGATGVTGKLAVQTAKLLGAGRVIAAGRNEKTLRGLSALGADATIQLHQPDLKEVFGREAGKAGLDVVIDYLWGRPTEALLSAITRRDLFPASTRTRLVEVGESAGPSISLSAATLRSTRLEILGAGTGSAPPLEMWFDANRELMAHVASGRLRIDVERGPLADVDKAWERDQHGRRTVLIP
jgi:NADPH:quinone reductase-like Zn-dependent oxidoreductase